MPLQYLRALQYTYTADIHILAFCEVDLVSVPPCACAILEGLMENVLYMFAGSVPFPGDPTCLWDLPILLPVRSMLATS